METYTKEMKKRKKRKKNNLKVDIFENSTHSNEQETIDSSKT